MNFNTAPENSPLENSETKIDDAVKELISILFLKKYDNPPTISLQHLVTSIHEYAKGNDIPEHVLDRKIMLYINKQMENLIIE